MVDRDFELIDGTALDDSEVLAVLSDGYGRPFLADWLDWKHRCGPWGPSRCVVAQDSAGPLGVVFGLPWRFLVNGQPVDGIRLVDGATTPRAVRRGVFRAICKELVDPSNAPRRAIVIATATPEAQAAHVKNGAVALDPIQLAYRPVGLSRAAVDTDDRVLDRFEPRYDERAITSAWDPSTLRWRLDARFGAEYSASRLANSDAVHGVIHRTASRKGARVLIVTTTWGATDVVVRLLRALAWREKAVAVFGPVGAGTPISDPRMGLSRGQSLLCVWDRTGSSVSSSERSDWKLDGLELEGFV